MGSPKINDIGLGAQGHVQKSRNHRNEGVEGSPISKSKSCKFELEQNNPTELLSISFPYMYYKNGEELAERFPIFPYEFPLIFHVRTSHLC